MTLTGTIREAGYEHPHGYVRLERRSKVWVVMLAPPSRMENRGLPAASSGPARRPPWWATRTARTPTRCAPSGSRSTARRPSCASARPDRGPSASARGPGLAGLRSRRAASRRRCASGSGSTRSSRSCTSWASCCWSAPRSCSTCACSGSPRLPVSDLARHLLPWSRSGSRWWCRPGFVMFTAHATEFANPAFRLKLILIALAGLNAGRSTVARSGRSRPGTVTRRRPPPRGCRRSRRSPLDRRHRLRAPARLSLTSSRRPRAAGRAGAARRERGVRHRLRRHAARRRRLGPDHPRLSPAGHRVRHRRPGRPARRAPRDGVRSRARIAAALFWMGFVGFTLAMALAHWGLAWSTATNAALLVATEPVALVALAPIVLGERLTRREGWGTLLALRGRDRRSWSTACRASPSRSCPHWRGDLLLLLSGVCFAAYSLLGRPVLARHSSITRHRVVLLLGRRHDGAARRRRVAGRRAVPPGRRRAWPPCSTSGSSSRDSGYLVWNWALERVTAARAAIYLNVQPLVGALLGVVWLGEPLSVFTVAGGALVVLGLWLAADGPPGLSADRARRPGDGGPRRRRPRTSAR